MLREREGRGEPPVELEALTEIQDMVSTRKQRTGILGKRNTKQRVVIARLMRLETKSKQSKHATSE